MSLEGQQLGRYRLKLLIGSGGMGEVYLAQDPGINRQVAIKVVRVEASAYARTITGTLPGMRSVTGAGMLGSQDAAGMFQREAKAIAMLDHPGILPLYDYGEQNVNGGMLTYMVMPYREEGSLANWLQKGGFKLLSVQGVEQMIQQAAAALQYAHDHQVVHQDVKPSNFLIRTSREHPKHPDLLLTDFGIAKLSMLTTRASQSIRGTPTYMAPEQWEGHPVPATDQYALAVMLYELLTGRPPFRGTPMQMMYAHVNTQPKAPSTLNPRLSSAIDTVVLRGLAKKPEERFPSIIAFAFAFRQTLRSIDPSIAIGISSREEVRESNIPLNSIPATKNVETSLSYSSKQASNDHRRKLSRVYLTLLAVLICLLVASSAGLFYYLGGRHSTTNTNATATARVNMFRTATAQTNATAVARSGATATAVVHATATVNARKDATATAIATGANPYPPYSGSLALNDPMIDNNQGYQWQVYNDSTTGNSCQFVDGAFHVVDAPSYWGACFATATDFSNFTYQIEMTFLKAGQSFDGGGIAIRRSGDNYYYFEVFESGRYKFVPCTGNDCSLAISKSLSQAIPSFRTGLNQPNTIAIVVNGNSFDLYVNGEHVAGPVSDPNNTSSHGMIGVFGAANDVTTEVVYKDAKVWR